MNTQKFNATFDAQAKIEEIRSKAKILKPKGYKISSLEVYRAELVKLRKGGLSYKELALYLSIEHRKKVSHTTIMRYLKKLPEMKTDEIKDRDEKSLDVL